MITYDYYRIFYYVAQYKSFTKAARALHNNQPNITRCMNNLEQELKCTLFLRSNKGIALTPEGRQLYEHVALAFEHHREVDDHAAKRRRAALDEMRLRAILTDVLSVIELVHQLNQQRSAHNRHDERHHNADDE